MTIQHTRNLLLAAVGTLAIGLGADWPQFRGPGGEATSTDSLPITWNETQNIVWKTALPGFGSSSPIVIGDKIFLTCYSGYALDQDQPGDRDALVRHVLCLGRSDGKILWDKTDKARQPETDYKNRWITNHGYSSSTPVSDGQALYVFFGASGVYAYSLSGDPLWQADVGQKPHAWGSGTSPILAGNLVFINASVESDSVVALDKTTGKQVWKTGGIKDSWSTPALVDLPGGKQELVVSIKGKVLGLDAADGNQLWECASVPDYVCPSVIAHKDIVYVTGARKPQFAMAIRAGGRGDVTATHKLWEAKKTPKVATPLYHDGLLYWIDQTGVATCLKADSGEVVYSERLELAGAGDKVYASLVLAGDKLYGVTRRDGTLVFPIGPKFNKLAQNRLDPSMCNATPAIVDGRLLLRSDQFLYCIGK